MQSSSHKLENLEDPDSQNLTAVMISAVDGIATGQYINLSAKVVKLDNSVPVQNKSGKVLHKQEAIFADESGCTFRR